MMAAPSQDDHLSILLGRLQAWIGQSGSFDALLCEAFGTCGAGGELLISDLVSSLESGQLTIRILAGTEMVGLRGAYAVEPQSARELILLNQDWLASATVPEIEAVLLEELGHAIDPRLNGDRDTVGDEGERFSALVRGEQPAESAATENDLVTVRLEGLELIAEASAQQPSLTPPAAPAITDIVDDVSSDTVANSGDVSDDATPTLTITAAPGSVVRVFDHGIYLGTATETATAGTFTYTTPTLQVGGHSFTARASDANGNISDASAAFAMSVGVTGSILYGGITYNLAFTVSNKDNLTDGSYTLVATGQAAGDTVQYRSSATGTGSWGGEGSGASPFTKDISVTSSGTYYYQVRIDFDGGTSYDWTSDTLAVTVNTTAAVASADTTAPGIPTLVSSIPSSGGQVLTLNLTGETGSTVLIFDGSTRLGAATESGIGSFTFTTDVLATGSHSLTWRAIDPAGNASALSAALSHTVASSTNNAPTGLPLITGTATQAVTLSVDTSAIADDDGLGTFSYQWNADGSAISGATGTSLLLTQALVGKTITVTASYTDNGGTIETLTSAATAAVADIDDAPTGAVTISGTATQGQTLSASNTLADADGIPSSGAGAITYQWIADGTPISGATASTYTLTQAEVGKAITVTATYTDNGGYVQAIASSATALVAAPPAPTLVASTPSDGNSAVSVAADITLVFSEAVQAGSGNITITDGSGNVVRTIAASDATQVRFDGSKVIINPAGDLAALSNYSVQIAAGAITNLTGTAYAGISDTTSLNFTTGRILYATTEKGNTNSAGVGTSSDPYQSLGYASQVAQAGDTIYLTVTNSSGAPLSGSEAIGNSYTIRSNGTAPSPVVIKPNPASSDRYVFTSANGMIVTGSHTVIEGFEFYGKTDAVDYWSLVAKSWGFGGAIDDTIYPVGDIAINVTTGSNILIKDNYFHDLVQKAVNIEGGRYIEVRNNIIENVATTSLSGGHGIMRQQGSYSNFGTPDQAGLYRWDITGNLIFNVEQRIYSWVPSKGYLNMTLDEGKPINIDETTDTQMQARISENIIGYANIDSIRLKPTANLEVSFNSIYSDGVHADGITDNNTLGISTPFPGITVTGNLVQTAAGTFGFELNDAFNLSGSNYSSSNNIMFGGTASNLDYFTGVSAASAALFNNPEQGDFSPTTAAGNAGASGATRASLAALVASQGVTVADDNWSVDERKLVQALLDNIPGIRDGITDNETIFEEAGMLYADSLKESGHKAFYFAVDPTWKTANGVTDSSLDRPGTTYDGLYEIVVPIEYSDWLDAILATYQQWDGSAFNGASYSSARFGDSYIEQSKYFDATGLSVFQINSASDFSKTTTSAGRTIGLDGDILLDLSNYTGTGSQSFDIVTAGVVTAVDGPGNIFDHVRLKLASGSSYSHQLTLVDSDANGSTDTLRLTLNSTSSPPSEPVLSLGTGVDNGATAAESTQVGGVVTVTAEAGASVAVSFSRTGGGTVTKTVTGADATPVAVVLDQSDLSSLGDGTIDVSAIATNAAGSSTPGTISFTLDTLAPAAPTFALASDTGSSNSDGITNNGTVTVSGLETGATWEYSTNNGTDWTPGAGSSFLLGEGTYASGTVRVRQRDLAGNTSSPSQNGSAITVDPAAPTTATVTSVNEGTTGPVIGNGGTSNGTAALLVSGGLAGALATDETVQVFDGTTFLGTASVTADSTSWSYTDRRVLVAGQTVNYTAGVLDIAGNQSASTTPYVITQTSSLPEISVNNVSVVEGAAGTTNQAAFTVRLSRASTQPITVAYQVIPGTATSGSDYTAATGAQTLTFNPGVIALQVPFTVSGDSAEESDETLSLQLSSPTNASFAAGSITAIAATGTIMNDDTNPNQGIVITSAGNFKGSDFNDTLTGDSGVNQINGLLGDDTIAGLGRADAQTGGGGADTFVYTALSDSTLTEMDFITDFNVGQGDKIDLNFTATTVWNRGVIPASTLQGALQLAFADKDTAASGNQALAVNEVVVFQWGTSSLRRNTYIASPDAFGANFNGDLLIKLPNNTFGAIDTGAFL